MKFNENNPIGALFFDSTSRYGDKVAIRTPARDISYADLREMVTNFALNLQVHGIGRDAVIGLDLGQDAVQATVSILAITLIGGQWIEYAAYLKEHNSISVTHLLHDNPRRETRSRSLLIDERWYEPPAGHPVHDTYEFPGYLSADDTWFLAASSGTTGTVKNVAISGRVFIERISRITEYPAGDETFSATDLFRRYTMLACVHFFHTLKAGGTYLLGANYEYLLSQNCKLVVGSPSQLAGLLANIPPPEAPGLFEVRVVGGALYPQFLSKLLKYFQMVRASYGSTEAGPVCSRLIEGYTEDRSVGSCYAGVVVEIVDDSDGPLSPGQEGIVRIKTTNPVESYVGDTGVSVQSFKDGWFYPGDKGYLSASGELTISGRLQDHLNLSGGKVNAVVMDEIMQNTAGVVDALCFVEMNADGVENLAALVVFEADADKKIVVKDLLRALLTQKIMTKLLPKTFYQVTELPRNANGKAMRHQAASLVAGLEPVARVGK